VEVGEGVGRVVGQCVCVGGGGGQFMTLVNGSGWQP
jgi:hypothetical protein